MHVCHNRPRRVDAVIVETVPPDPVLANSWMPVVNSTDVTPGAAVGVALLDQPLVLWRTGEGVLRAARDQCPHRGSALSLGEVRGEELMCAYHGWRFDTDGACTFRPALPEGTVPPNLGLAGFAVREAYGVIWVGLGQPPAGLDYFPEYDEPGARHVHHPTVVLHASGPRIIENFLDMAHFPFVHGGILGAESHTRVREYDVEVTERGVEARNCWFWQPAATPTSGEGAEVEYSYRVPHPYVATLRKIPQAEAPAFDLMIIASPADETHCRAWMVASYHSTDVSEEDFFTFNDRIFGQDIPIVESQRPKCLPLDPMAERHQSSDKISHAYRRWLRELGLRYGVIAKEG
jgi:phenylpropionate dioxygenase-like ring-hydroxylating dioxygenase large terminal subunit